CRARPLPQSARKPTRAAASAAVHAYRLSSRLRTSAAATMSFATLTASPTSTTASLTTCPATALTLKRRTLESMSTARAAEALLALT
ncbi:hypothetical protein IWW38_004684, partial [Coemansia aciculifera]